MLVFALGRLLIGDHADGAHNLAALQYIGKERVRGHEPTAEAAPQREHFALRPGIDEWFVGGIERKAQLVRERKLEPLPIALMGRDDDDRRAFAERLTHELNIGDRDVRGEFLGAHAHGLHDLDQHLREARVIAAHERAQPRLVKLGESDAEILAHHVLAIGKHPVGQPADQRRERIQGAQRQGGGESQPPGRSSHLTQPRVV